MKKVSVGQRDKWEDSISDKDFVLDVGCWGGEKVGALMNKTKHVFGMDINKDRLDCVNKKIKGHLKFGDITKDIPFEYKFDWIIFGEVLEHVDDDNAALKNIAKSLKNGGKLILTTPRSVPFFQIWDPAWFRWKFLGGQRHYHYKQKELFLKLKNSGFSVEKYYIIGNFNWVAHRWVNALLEYVFGARKNFWKIKTLQPGFCNWIILAKKLC